MEAVANIILLKSMKNRRIFPSLDRSPLKRGTGAILCPTEKLSAFDNTNLIVPIGLL
jgi:hypothetical protein